MIKTLFAVGALTLAVGCTETIDPVDTEAAAEVGVCGANMDPLTGIECRYGAATPTGDGGGRRARVETGADGLDYIVCYIDVTCLAHGEAVNGGRTCQSVVGTGCPDRVTTATQRDAWPLPPGAPMPTPEELAQACRYDIITSLICDAVPPVTIEQGEDLCCVLREPTAPPPKPRVIVAE